MMTLKRLMLRKIMGTISGYKKSHTSTTRITMITTMSIIMVAGRIKAKKFISELPTSMTPP